MSPPGDDAELAAPADGTLLGERFLLGELLGVGGSASVFAADDVTAPGSRVAVKLLHPHLCADAAAREAFLREASQVQRLRHANVVSLHAAGVHDAGGVAMPWIALDLLRGPTLRERVQRHGPLEPADAAAVLDGVLAGIAAAHAAGIVHRDLTPQNVVLDAASEGAGADAAGPLRSESVRIVDFGLADATGRSTVGSDVLLARPGTTGVIGNAAFMSPEQAQGLPVRSVSDLYQAGALLYFALTGQAPFPRENVEQTLRAHVAAPPPVPSALATGARAFDRVVVHAMAKTPAHRYRNADQFRADLAEAARRIETAAPIAEPELADLDADGPDGEDAPTRLYPVGREADGAMSYLEPARPERPSPTVPAAGGVFAAIAAVGVVAVAIVIATVSASSGDTAATPSPTSSVPAAVASPSATGPQPTPPAPAPVPTPHDTQPVVETVAVPALTGSLDEARASLVAAGLQLGRVIEIESERTGGRVLSQSPVAGGGMPRGSVVDVTVASGWNVVPQVSGMTIAAARAQLESAGFVAVASPVDAAATGTATGSQPAAGAVLRLGVTVTVTAAPEPTPSATADDGEGEQ